MKSLIIEVFVVIVVFVVMAVYERPTPLAPPPLDHPNVIASEYGEGWPASPPSNAVTVTVLGCDVEYKYNLACTTDVNGEPIKCHRER